MADGVLALVAMLPPLDIITLSAHDATDIITREKVGRGYDAIRKAIKKTKSQLIVNPERRAVLLTEAITKAIKELHAEDIVLFGYAHYKNNKSIVDLNEFKSLIIPPSARTEKSAISPDLSDMMEKYRGKEPEQQLQAGYRGRKPLGIALFDGCCMGRAPGKREPRSEFSSGKVASVTHVLTMVNPRPVPPNN